MQRLRAIGEKIKADVKRAPMWVWIGLALTLLLVYFAWRSAHKGSASADTSGLPLPDSGGVGGGGALPLPTPPTSSDLPLIPAPPDTLGSDSFSDLVSRGQTFGQRVAGLDIRSGHGINGQYPWLATRIPIGYGAQDEYAVSAQLGRTIATQQAHRGVWPPRPFVPPAPVYPVHYATEGGSSGPTTFRIIRGHGEVID